MGCGVAASAVILDIDQDTLVSHFVRHPPPGRIDPAYHPYKHGVWAEQIVDVLKTFGREYTHYAYIDDHNVCVEGCIVFVCDETIYTRGHYLVYSNDKWLDSWINLQYNINIDNAEAGFRDDLSGFMVLWVIMPVTK